MKNSVDFQGPIFVVGMARSGTKLLRDLLNNHSQIAITVNESGCIPYFYLRRDKYGELQDRENFLRFYRDFSGTTFFERITAVEDFVDEERWYGAINDWSYAGVISAFFGLYASKQNKPIWGDKTPGYMLDIPLLKSLFPSAKFVHIIRDPRDYCLSINRAWNKNIYRAAQRWHDSINKCRKDVKQIPQGDYLEVQYESLLDSPEAVLQEICSFLGLEYEPGMPNYDRKTENLGDARDTVGILKKNYGKWKSFLGTKSVAKIESLCKPLLTELNYQISYTGETVRLSQFDMLRYKIVDGLNFWLFELRTNSLKGLSNIVKSRKRTRSI